MNNQLMFTTIGFFLVIAAVNSSHFLGGTISWRVQNSATSSTWVAILITQTYSWTYTTGKCENGAIAANQPVPGSGGTLTCSPSCPAGFGSVSATPHCTDVSPLNGIVVGQRSDIVLIPEGSDFSVIYASGAWGSLTLNKMAIYRTRTHFDIDTSRYEHEYIINNYSKVFRYLHIETPDYEIRNEACKYNFIIEPGRRHILINVIMEFPLTLTERRCFEVIAECYNEIRTSASTTNSSTANNSLSNPSRKSSRTNIMSQTSKLISHDENQIVYSRVPDEVDLYDSDEYSDDGFVNNRRYVKLRLDLDDISSIKKLRIKIKCTYNRILSNESIEPQLYSSINDQQNSIDKNDLSLLELFHKTIPYDIKIEIGTHTFHAHRHILMLRSDYFKTSFGSHFNDCTNNPLKLSGDIDVNAFDILLKYLYTNRIEHAIHDELLLIELFKLSDRFLIDSLKHQCLIELLRNHINKDNVFSYLDLLDTYHGCDELREKCFGLFHKYSDLLKTPAFNHLEKNNPKLALQIYGSFF
ncbi:unnamed protein product [Rotaria sp. Silwood1]|nr:unnamed protein product [Rotaria sp. Silwood1]